MQYTIITLASLFTALNALTITSPSAGSIVDPSQPIVITWTSTPADPATINLVLDASPDSLFSVRGTVTQVGTNVPTSAGTFTVPGNLLTQFGAGYTFVAQSLTGDALATSNSFILGLAATAQTSLSSLTFDTSGLDGQSVTATYLPGSPISSSFSNGVTVIPNPTATGLSSLVFTTDGVTGSMTIQPTSTVRSTTAPATTSHASSSSAATTVAQATNAQPKIGAAKEVMGLAGLLAGLVAIF